MHLRYKLTTLNLSFTSQNILGQPFWQEFPTILCKKKIFQDALSAKSTGTIASYFYKCREFFNWLQQNHCTLTLPINERIIAGFVSHSISKSKSDSVIVTTAAAIKWLHSLVNSYPNPVDSPLVQNIIMGGRKQLHKPPTQK